MKSILILGLANIGFGAALPLDDPVTTRVPEPTEGETRTFDNPFPTIAWPTEIPIPPPPFKRDDPVVTRTVDLGGGGNPFPTFVYPTELPNLPPINPPVKRQDIPVITRSVDLPGPFGKREAEAQRDYVTTRKFVLPPPPFKREAEAQRDYVTTRKFELPPFPPLEKRAEAPYPEYLQVVGITYGGTGCPAKAPACSVNDYGRELGFATEAFTASVGPTVDITESRKNCQFNINLKYPTNWQYALTSISYTGSGTLEKGVQGVVKATEYFSGQTAQESFGFTLNGPFDSAFVLRDYAEGQDILWSPCGTNAMLNVNAQVALTSPYDSFKGRLTLDQPLGKQLFLSWRRC